MKLIVLIFDEAIDAQVMQTLHDTAEKCNCACRYSKIRGVEGAGSTGERDGTWKHPGLNNMVFCVAQDEQIPILGHALDDLKDRLVADQGDRPYLGVNMIVAPADLAILGGETFRDLTATD
jgi:hypothetical protein